MKKIKSCRSFILIILTLIMNSCLPEGEFRTELNYIPLETGDGWEVSDPRLQGLDPDRLMDVYNMMYQEEKFITSRSLLIVKNGKLVSESYFRDSSDMYMKNNIQGITKSVTSLLAGIACDRELFDPGDTLYNYIPGYFDGDINKRDITIENLLTMTAGLAWDNDVNTIDLFNSSRYPSSMRIVLTKSFLSAPGTSFHYNHGTPQLVSGLLGKLYDYSDNDSIIKQLFDPLGIDDYVWERHDDGIYIGGLGLHLKPRDIALIGQFCIQKGVWGGSAIVSDGWLNESTRARIGPEETGTSLHFGYFWWIDAENNAFFGMGEGGQYLYIVPSEELVIVHTASPNVGHGYEGISTDDFLSLVDLIIGSLVK